MRRAFRYLIGAALVIATVGCSITKQEGQAQQTDLKDLEAKLQAIPCVFHGS